MLPSLLTGNLSLRPDSVRGLSRTVAFHAPPSSPQTKRCRQRKRQHASHPNHTAPRPNTKGHAIHSKQHCTTSFNQCTLHHHTERRARINCHASQRLPWTDTLSILFTQRHLQTWKEVRIRDCPILEIEVGSYVTLWGLLLLSHVQLQRRCTAAAIGLCFCPVCVIQTA